MPPELVMPAAVADPALPLSTVWRGALLRLAATWTALIALFAGDWAKMFGQWWNSSTYNHVLLVPAILAWLVCLRT